MVACLYQINKEKKDIFVKKLLKWHKKNFREFTWRKSDDPYQIIIAEMMLQKTDAEKVEPIFKSFIIKYPELKTLANADIKEIKEDINILGIHRRAERMKNLANNIIEDFNGEIPKEKEQLMSLIGVGGYISNAVLCFAYNKDTPLVDTNSIRILERVFSIKTKKSRARTDKELWATLEKMIPKGLGREFNLAIIDFSALICKSRIQIHEKCPMRDICNYYNSL